MRIRHLLIALSIGFVTTPAFAATYQIDAEHSSVTFKIRHLFSNVQGTFNKFEGSFDFDAAQPEAAQTQATVQAASIDTNVAERDKHLQSPDFFDVAKFPTLTFKSTQFEKISDQKGKLSGNLTIHGVEKPVEFDVDILGEGKDPWGNVRAAFTATTKINRKDFGLNWNKAVEAGQLLVGEEVWITLDIEGLKQ